MKVISLVIIFFSFNAIGFCDSLSFQDRSSGSPSQIRPQIKKPQTNQQIKTDRQKIIELNEQIKNLNKRIRELEEQIKNNTRNKT